MEFRTFGFYQGHSDLKTITLFCNQGIFGCDGEMAMCGNMISVVPTCAENAIIPDSLISGKKPYFRLEPDKI